MKKPLGYLLFILGIAAVAISFSTVRSAIGINLPAGLTDLYMLIIGAALLLVGAFLGFGGKVRGKQLREIPVYHGKEIVAYRRTSV